MNKLAMAISLAAGLALQTANAGQDYNMPGGINVSIGSNSATGALTDVRFGTHPGEYIGCSHYAGKSYGASTTLSSNYIICNAINAKGRTFSCVSYSLPQAWVDTVAGLNNGTYLIFYADSSGLCTGIYTIRASSHL